MCYKRKPVVNVDVRKRGVIMLHNFMFVQRQKTLYCLYFMKIYFSLFPAKMLFLCVLAGIFGLSMQQGLYTCVYVHIVY